MVGPYELIVEALSILLGLSTVVVCLHKRDFSKYFFLNLYVLVAIAFSVGCFSIRSAYGYTSPQYFYFYYTGDALGNIVCYLLIGSFFDRLLRDSVFHKYVRPTLVITFLLIVGISGLFISGSVGRLHTRFVIEFQQNLYFVGVLLTMLLWISMGYLRAESRRFVLLVSGLGIYFSAHAANYAFQFLFAYKEVAAFMTRVPPLAYTVMVVLWLYTFWRVPEAAPVVEPAVHGSPQEALASVQSSSE